MKKWIENIVVLGLMTGLFMLIVHSLTELDRPRRELEEARRKGWKHLDCQIPGCCYPIEEFKQQNKN